MRVAVIGVGLIGGSVALAASERPEAEALEKAVERGAIGRACSSARGLR